MHNHVVCTGVIYPVDFIHSSQIWLTTTIQLNARMCCIPSKDGIPQKLPRSRTNIEWVDFRCGWNERARASDWDAKWILSYLRFRCVHCECRIKRDDTSNETRNCFARTSLHALVARQNCMAHTPKRFFSKGRFVRKRTRFWPWTFSIRCIRKLLAWQNTIIGLSLYKSARTGCAKLANKKHIYTVCRMGNVPNTFAKNTHTYSPRPRWHSKTFDISRTGMDDWLTCCQWIRMWFHFIFCKYATRVYFWIEARRKKKKRILFFGMNAHCRTLINSVINHRRVGLYVKKRQLTDSLSRSVTPFLWKKMQRFNSLSLNLTLGWAEGCLSWI